jgi:hypothetical protein
MTLAIAIENRLESEIARALEIMGHVRDRPEGVNEADTKAAFIDPILSALGWEPRDRFSVSQQYRSSILRARMRVRVRCLPPSAAL